MNNRQYLTVTLVVIVGATTRSYMPGNRYEFIDRDRS